MTPTAGLSFKAVHYEQAMACPAAGLWFEVHAENYMVDGGPRLAMLETLRNRFPLSIHGVGLSLAGVDLPDNEHLARLKRLTVRRFRPSPATSTSPNRRWAVRSWSRILRSI